MATIHIVEIIGTTPDGNLKYDLSADEHLTADQLPAVLSAASARVAIYLAALREDGTTGLRVFRVGATGQRFEVRR